MSQYAGQSFRQGDTSHLLSRQPIKYQYGQQGQRALDPDPNAQISNMLQGISRGYASRGMNNPSTGRSGGHDPNLSKYAGGGLGSSGGQPKGSNVNIYLGSGAGQPGQTQTQTQGQPPIDGSVPTSAAHSGVPQDNGYGYGQFGQPNAAGASNPNVPGGYGNQQGYPQQNQPQYQDPYSGPQGPMETSMRSAALRALIAQMGLYLPFTGGRPGTWGAPGTTASRSAHTPAMFPESWDPYQGLYQWTGRDWVPNSQFR